MTYEVVSTHSSNVLGTFDDEHAARRAVESSLQQEGATAQDLVVYVSDDRGEPVAELSGHDLVSWAGDAYAV